MLAQLPQFDQAGSLHARPLGATVAGEIKIRNAGRDGGRPCVRRAQTRALGDSPALGFPGQPAVQGRFRRRSGPVVLGFADYRSGCGLPGRVCSRADSYRHSRVGGLLFAAGAAWVSSRGPDLRMASDLIKDDESRFFRLKIENRGDGTMIPKVSIRRVVDVNGIDLVAQVPFELGWSHHERAVRPEIPSKMSETVGVAFLRDHSDAGRIRFYGMAFEPAYDPFLVDKERERIYRVPIFIQIEASILKLDQSKTQSRWFCLVPSRCSTIRRTGYRRDANCAERSSL